MNDSKGRYKANPSYFFSFEYFYCFMEFSFGWRTLILSLLKAYIVLDCRRSGHEMHFFRSASAFSAIGMFCITQLLIWYCNKFNTRPFLRFTYYSFKYLFGVLLTLNMAISGGGLSRFKKASYIISILWGSWLLPMEQIAFTSGDVFILIFNIKFNMQIFIFNYIQFQLNNLPILCLYFIMF